MYVKVPRDPGVTAESVLEALDPVVMELAQIKPEDLAGEGGAMALIMRSLHALAREIALLKAEGRA